MDMESSIGALLTSLIGQLPSLLVEMGFAIALLVMLLSRRNTLGRARTPALVGAGLLLALAILSRVVFAAISAFVLAGDLPRREELERNIRTMATPDPAQQEASEIIKLARRP